MILILNRITFLYFAVKIHVLLYDPQTFFGLQNVAWIQLWNIQNECTKVFREYPKIDKLTTRFKEKSYYAFMTI